ncbi:MAG: sigma 54-interacting transcriptional regulator, partial [Neisseria sp.]|nr:sigma 54-interacting transcriptional regulator [Neisseria sp.]
RQTHRMARKPQSEREEWRALEMLLLQQVIQNLGKDEGGHDTALKIMLQLMSELFGLNQGRIVLQHLNDENASIAHSYGMSREQVQRGVYAPNEGVTGAVLANSHMAIIDDVNADPAYLERAVPRADLPSEQTMFIALPIAAHNRTFGVLGCHRARQSRRPLHDDLSLLRILATLVGQLLYIHENNQARQELLQTQNKKLKQTLQSHSRRYGIVGSSAPLLKAVSELDRVAHSNANVLLLGENGTGKEMFARTLHTASRRVGQPFIKVPCNTDTVELAFDIFGTEQQHGLLEQADGGTVFFDEIAALNADMQNRLMTVLQENVVERLDGSRSQNINIRIITATERNLADEVEAGHFDPDLYYRLYVVSIELPPLRERRGDIPELAAYFMHQINRDTGRNVNLTAEAVDYLQHHNWPGNVYELHRFLKNLVEECPTNLADGALVWQLLNRQSTPETAPPLLKRLPKSKPAAKKPQGFAIQGNQARPYLNADSHSLEKIEETLAYCRGNKTQAAQMLGLSTRQLYYRLEKLKKEREEQS